MQQREITRWEQHLGAVVQVVIVALLLWSGKSLVELREKVAVMQVEVSALSNTVSQGSSNAYRVTDAARDLARVDTTIVNLERRVQNLERRTGDGPR